MFPQGCHAFMLPETRVSLDGNLTETYKKSGTFPPNYGFLKFRPVVAVTTVGKCGVGFMKSKVWRPLSWRKKTLNLVLQATFNLSQICKEVQKPYCGKGPG